MLPLGANSQPPWQVHWNFSPGSTPTQTPPTVLLHEDAIPPAAHSSISTITTHQNTLCTDFCFSSRISQLPNSNSNSNWSISIAPRTKDRGRITKSQVCSLVSVEKVKQKCFQLKAEGVGRLQLFQPCRQPVPCSWCGLKIWHLVPTIMIIFLRINWPNCMHFMIYGV